MEEDKMSNQSKVGRVLIDVRDICSTRVTQKLVESNASLSLNLTTAQIKDLSLTLKSELHKCFDSGIDAVIKEL